MENEGEVNPFARRLLSLINSLKENDPNIQVYVELMHIESLNKSQLKQIQVQMEAMRWESEDTLTFNNIRRMINKRTEQLAQIDSQEDFPTEEIDLKAYRNQITKLFGFSLASLTSIYLIYKSQSTQTGLRLKVPNSDIILGVVGLTGTIIAGLFYYFYFIRQLKRP